MGADFDCVVIGAGVVGLACARALACAGYDVVVLEANYAIGMETSSRNSEVIHSGIYYPQNSLKARACVRGRHLLYEYCDARHIPYKKLGKLIVATSAVEQAELEALLQKGLANGVDDLELISAQRARDMEPEISCKGALWSPSTGIIDSHAFMLALQGEIEDAGGAIAFNTPFLSGTLSDARAAFSTGGNEPIEATARLIVNCGALHAQAIAKSIAGYDMSQIVEGYFARGVYFSLSGKSPFRHLIYPAPEPGGLGVHATLDMAGQCRFGPDVEWIDEIDYEVDPRRGDIFYARVRKYWPGLKDGQLQPSYAGIRPKIAGPGQPAGDFMIQGPGTHKCGPLINLFGIESPGLTSSLALADYVLGIARNILG